MLNYLNGYVLYPLLERYAKRQIAAKIRELRQFSKLDSGSQKEIQKQKLIHFLRYCEAEVPYYKDVFFKTQFKVDKIEKDIKYLLELPVLTKQIVRENTERLKSQRAYHARKTGGSTGQSVFFYYDDEGLDWTAAINLFAYSLTNKKPHHKDMHSSADQDLLALKPKDLKGKWLQKLKLAVLNREVLMVSAFTDNNIKKMLNDIQKYSPYLLQAHPSTVYALASFVQKNNLNYKKSFSVYEPTGEMLTDKMADSIASAFGCKVVNRYGNAEFGVVAHSLFEDSHRRLMVFRNAFYAEVCEDAPLIITNFTNKGFPLIRYDTGDVATVREEEHCFIYDIKGRIHDLVNIHGQEYPTHFIMDILDHKVGGVREFQIALHDGKLPELKIVIEPGHREERVTEDIRKFFPVGLNISFVGFEMMETSGWRKKFRHVIDYRSEK